MKRSRKIFNLITCLIIWIIAFFISYSLDYKWWVLIFDFCIAAGMTILFSLINFYLGIVVHNQFTKKGLYTSDRNLMIKYGVYFWLYCKLKSHLLLYTVLKNEKFNPNR